MGWHLVFGKEGECLRNQGKESSQACRMGGVAPGSADDHLGWDGRCRGQVSMGEGQQPGSGNEEQVGWLPSLLSSRPRRSSVWERQRGCGSRTGGQPGSEAGK